MTDEEIQSLRHGDIILIDRGSCSYFRTVIEGPADCSDNWRKQGVTVPKRQRSQYQRTTTILDVHFLRNNAIHTGKRARKAMGGDEVSRLLDMGFNVAKEIVREIREAAEAKTRMISHGQRLKREACEAITSRMTQAASEYRTLTHA